jgi:hypothetical protein
LKRSAEGTWNWPRRWGRHACQDRSHGRDESRRVRSPLEPRRKRQKKVRSRFPQKKPFVNEMRPALFPSRPLFPPGPKDETGPPETSWISQRPFQAGSFFGSITSISSAGSSIPYQLSCPSS